MRKTKTIRFFAVALAVLLLCAALVFGVACLRQIAIQKSINNDYREYLVAHVAQAPVFVDGFWGEPQAVRGSGFAIVSMLAAWNGRLVSEQQLIEEYGGTAVGTSRGMESVLREQFPAWQVERRSNLTNTELLETTRQLLKSGWPVPVALAFEMQDCGWTLQYALVIGLDLSTDSVFLLNPFGQEVRYNVRGFLTATRFDSYSDMPLCTWLQFAGGRVHRNTVFVLQPAE